jgi:uncharacterized membrane protein YccC
VDYILHLEVTEDGEPIATLEEFHDYAGEQRAKRAALAAERKAANAAKLATEAKAKADREATEAERLANVEHLATMLTTAKQLVAQAEALPGAANMVEHVEQRALVTEADRQVNATISYATTHGLVVPTEMGSLVARLGPIRHRVGV